MIESTVGCGCAVTVDLSEPLCSICGEFEPELLIFVVLQEANVIAAQPVVYLTVVLLAGHIAESVSEIICGG